MSFRQLHVPGQPFILANAWDLGSARILAALGAKAIATSSAAHAFTLGLHDLGEVSRAQSVQHAAEMAAAVEVPVSADCENGYGDSPEAVAQTIREVADAGVAGACIEDMALADQRPYSFDQAVTRIEAAAEAARASATDFVLTARADGVMHGCYDLDEAIRRLQAFERAGADVLYVPIPGDIEALKQICRTVSAPVNALAAGPLAQHSLAELAAAGAARVSLGASLARVTHRALIDSARILLSQGDFAALSHSISGAEVERLIDLGTASR
ncbi:MAG: isocitrate lyase/phosphoenolpyruvate mutase family protein [Xanthomonadales bacterium]|nr:isocitrate lyase/phosphoenolpyruvate mutase family protein [Xanthomonadales bacterium]